MLLLGERSSVSRAVSVGHGVLILILIRGAVVVLVVFPLSNIGGVASYGRGNLGIPTGKDVVCAIRGTIERRGSGAGREVAIHLIGKDFFVSHAVSVGYGVLRSHAQDMVLGRSVHHSPLAIYPFQIDNALVCLAGIGSVSALCNVQLGVKRIHILVERIDLHFAVISVMYNTERVVDQSEGLAAVVGFVVGADDLYRIVVQQILDIFIAGFRGRGIAFNVDLSGINKRFRTRPLPAIRIPGRVYRHNGGRVFMLHIAGMAGMLAIVKLEILRQINGDRAFPVVAVLQLLLITHRVIAVLQTIAGIVGAGSLANDIDNVLAKVKVHAHFGISGCCITYNLKDDRSTALHEPCIILVFQRNSRGVILGRVDCAGIGVELLHILLRVDGDRAGVRTSAALNVTNGKRAVQQGICPIGVVNAGVGAVNCHHVITQQFFDVISAGLAGLCR